MLTFSSFTGINNVLPSERLAPDRKTGAAALTEAMNVDIGMAGEARRRKGYSVASVVCHKNVWQGASFMLATANGDLINSATQAVLYASLGVSRVWYTNLPDGRTTFSNGLICGITDGTTTAKWGIPLPAADGAPIDVAGALNPGKYRIALTHVRLSDGLEGGTTHLTPFTVATGGIVITGLPLLADHKTNVYLSSANDDALYLAGTTAGSTFSFTAANDTLTLACKTDQCYPAPAGILTAFWRGRTLLASGKLLLASRNQQWELFDLAKDLKQFSSDITLVQPVDTGIWVGTGKELAFLSGAQFDGLTAHHNTVPGAVVLGSGVTVDGANIKVGNGVGSGPAMICIAGGGYLYAGLESGSAVNLTDGVYTTAATEVAATFRVQSGIPQYIAIPQ
jgi:hypothetical protein